MTQASTSMAKMAQAGTRPTKPVLLIGSYALHKIYKGGAYKDIDFIADYDSAIKYIKSKSDSIKALYPSSDGKKVIAHSMIQVISTYNKKELKPIIFEAEITWPGSTAERIYDSVTNGSYYANILNMHEGPTEDNEYIPSLSVLYAIKFAHRFKDHVSFEKTRKFLMSHPELSGVENTFEWYEARMQESLKDHPKLNVSKKEFFRADEIYNVYDHDDIHEAVKLSDVPAYRNLTTGEVQFSIASFRMADKEKKLACVYEEAAVLALERIIIMREQKGEDKGNLSEAFKTALIKVCTSITSGYFREYAYKVFDTIIAFNDRYDNEWYAKYREALEKSKIRKFSN